MRLRLIYLVLAITAALSAANPPRGRWTPGQAAEYWNAQPYAIGGNFLPQDAINELEMWQAETFNPAEIDREFGWAEGIGMNTMRVFLHDLLWQQDSAGLTKRIDQFLAIAAKHRIRPVLVLFDSCWDPQPKLGPQHPPIPGVHNSGWVQSPGRALGDTSQRGRLRKYVVGVVGAFANDRRILAWDLWNEPDNSGGGDYTTNLKNKIALVEEMLPQVFEWARSVGPVQPVTSGVWQGDNWGEPSRWSKTERTQLSESDIISFHDYSWPEVFERRIKQLLPLGRPVLCTEYMARGAGSTFDNSLPVAAKYNVGAINWGLVNGKSQTHLPWDSWQRPYTLQQPPVWFHDVFRGDGTPYRQAEADLIKRIATEKVRGARAAGGAGGE